MPVYVCRWQNGDFSVAYAGKREEADLLFDEIGNPDLAEVFRVRTLAIHFKLPEKEDANNALLIADDALPVELECFDERSYGDLGPKLYPDLWALDIEPDEAAVRSALEKERKRQWGKKKARLSTDSEERYLQEVGPDIPRSLARSVVREMREERAKKKGSDRR